MTTVTVLSQMNDEAAAEIARRVEGIEIVAVPPDFSVAPPQSGEVLLAVPRFGTPRSVTRPTPVPWAGQLKWVQLTTAGVDAYPEQLFQVPRITRASGVMDRPIAEFVVATLLAFEKRIPRIWEGGDHPVRTDGPLGTLHDRVIGIVGLGSIGRAIAARVLPFGSRVLGTQRTLRPSGIDGVDVVPLDELLRRADHIVVAAPATPETHHIIGRDALSKVKPGVHVVNIARGTLIDQDALLEALDDGRVGVASLDVTDPEPLPEGHPLAAHPNVRISPHVSYSSAETRSELIDLVVANLKRYLAGEPLVGLIDPGAGY